VTGPARPQERAGRVASPGTGAASRRIVQPVSRAAAASRDR
jgi:hypothetical protein